MNYDNLYNKYKEKYENLKKQNRNNFTKYKNFTGAGIIILEDYNNNKGRQEPAVILFKNSHMLAYADLGGHIDNDDLKSKNPLMKTATREAFEESCGLLNFKKIPDIYVDLPHYRCYFVKINSEIVMTDDFRKNMKTILTSKLPNYFKETIDIARFYISDLLKTDIMTIKGDFPTIDSKGNIAIVTGRAKALIREAIRSGIIYSNDIVKLQKKQIKLYNVKLTTLYNQ